MSDELREFDKTQEQPHVLRAELERVKQWCAVMREALEYYTTATRKGCNHIPPHRSWLEDDGKVARKALSSTAGSDYVSKAEVRQIAEALQRMDSLLEKMFAAPWGKTVNLPTQEINEAFAQSRKALGVAREHGLLEDKQ